jgi:hypothetical protein
VYCNCQQLSECREIFEEISQDKSRAELAEISAPLPLMKALIDTTFSNMHLDGQYL